jgi:hypothetical protein
MRLAPPVNNGAGPVVVEVTAMVLPVYTGETVGMVEETAVGTVPEALSHELDLSFYSSIY